MKGNHLIIGGCGMVGAHLALNAFKESNLILVDDLSGFGSVERLKMIREVNPNIIFCQADICDTAALEAIQEMAQKRMGGISSTIFAAGIPNGQTARHQPSRTIKVYSQGLMNAIEAHVGHSHYQPFIFISNYLIYGCTHPCITNTVKEDGKMELQQANGLVELPDDLPSIPDTLLGHCVRHGEEILRWYCQKGKLRSAFCVRPSMLYGDIFPQSQSDMVQYVIRCVYESKMAQLSFSPLSVMDVLHLEDLGELLVRITEIDFPGHVFFQAGGGRKSAISLTKIMFTIKDILGTGVVDCNVSGTDEPNPNWYVSNLTMAASMDWKPRIQPIRGIQSILTQLRKNT